MVLRPSSVHGTIFGPVAGAFVIAAMESYLSDLGAWVTIAQESSSWSACSPSAAHLGELEAWLRRRRKG